MDDIRNKFAEKIAERINEEITKRSQESAKRKSKKKAEYDSELDEAYIFGIFGKWGEGKTDFLLKKLKPKLIKDPYNHTVVYISAWQYASDQTAFLRNFIYKLSRSSKKMKWWKKPFFNLHLKVFTKRMESEHSSVGLEPMKFLYSLLATILGILIGLLIVKFYPNQSANFYYWYKDVSSALGPVVKNLLGVGIITTFALQFLTVKKTEPLISTIDEFEEILKFIIKKVGPVVIFLDDFDRLNKSDARNIIDSLRTFFNINELVFIIAGDQQVLQSYYGEEYSSEGKNEQNEIGHSFLKKIFNTYWILPLPIRSDLEVTVSSHIKNKKLDIFFNEKQQLVLINWCVKYFNSNYRDIERFISRIRMAFNYVEYLNEESRETEYNRFYDDIIEHPLHLVRAIMYEEFVYVQYELFRSGESVTQFERFFNSYNLSDEEKTRFTKNQLSFLDEFLKEDVRFYKDETGQEVAYIEPFFQFAGERDLSPSQGPTAQHLWQSLQSEELEVLTKQLELLSLNNVGDAAKYVVDDMNRENQDEKRLERVLKILPKLLQALVKVDRNDVHPFFYDSIKRLELKIPQNIEVEEKIKFYLLFWKWLDKCIDIEKVEYQEVLSSFQNRFPLEDVKDFNLLEEYIKDENSSSQQLGRFSSFIISKWFCNAYTKESSKEIMHSFLQLSEFLNAKTIEEYFASTRLDDRLSIERLIDEIANNTSKSKDAAELVVKYYPDGKNIVKQFFLDEVETSINKNNHAAWTAVYENSALADIITLSDLVTEMGKLLSERISVPFFKQVLLFMKDEVQKHSLDVDRIWAELLKQREQVIYDYLDSVIDDRNYESLSPNEHNANKIFEKLMSFYSNIQVSEKHTRLRILNMLNQDKWLWKNLDNVEIDESQLPNQDADPKIDSRKASMIESWNKQ